MELLTSTSTLAVLDLAGDFMVCIDTFLEGIGEILIQDERVISYEVHRNNIPLP